MAMRLSLFAVFGFGALADAEVSTSSLRGAWHGAGSGSPLSANGTNTTTASDESAALSAPAPAQIVHGSAATEGMGGACLCLFDIDRTLTGKQGVAGPTCPQNSIQNDVYDDAYGGGDLTLSNLGQQVSSTACAQCKLGLVSHGTAGGNAMKGKIRSLIEGSGYIPNQWSYPNSIDSPLVLGCSYKPSCVRDVVDWYNRQGAGLSPGQVYIFDDKRDNVESFDGSGFNAHQISCASRDWGEGGQVGFCGGTTGEIRLAQGISTC